MKYQMTDFGVYYISFAVAKFMQLSQRYLKKGRGWKNFPRIELILSHRGITELFNPMDTVAWCFAHWWAILLLEMSSSPSGFELSFS